MHTKIKSHRSVSRIVNLFVILALVLTGALSSLPGAVRAAAELVEWTSVNSTGSLDADFVAANVAGVPLSRTGILYNDGGTYNSRDWETSDTLNLAKYLEWGVTPASGYEINLTDFDIRYDRSGTGPAKLKIYVSTDNFATVNVLVHTDDAVSDVGEDNPNIDLSSVPTVAPGQTALFRLYGYNASSSAGTFDIENVATWGGKGIRIRGTVTPAGGDYINLTLSKTATPGVVEQGNLVTYTLLMANSGNISDPNVSLTDTLPSEVDFAYWINQPLDATANGDQITWNGEVASSESITFTFAVTNLVESGAVVNTVYFSGTQQSGSSNASFSVMGTSKIHAIQGDGLVSPLLGETHTIEGVVVGDFQPTEDYIRGFFVQEEDADADDDPLTSEGIFIYHNTTDVNVGDLVRVSGTVQEYYEMTQLGSVTSVSLVDSGNPLPTVTQISLPFSDTTYLERYEGMLIEIPQTLYVTEIYKLGRGGELLLSADARLMNPTQVITPGQPAIDLQATNNLNKIILDDGSLQQNPDPIIYPSPFLSATNTVRGGDAVAGIVGVLSYSYSGWTGTDAYRIHPIEMPTLTHVNPRPTSNPDVGGTLRIASFNTLNYFDTFTECRAGAGGVSTDCRGANNLDEFNRQRDKIIAAMLMIDADVFGLMEIENDGYADEASAIDDLVDGLNAIAGAGTYAYVDADARTGGVNVLGTDAIKVGMIYKPATAILTGTTAVIDSSVDPNFDSSRNRPALAQAFAHAATGDVVTVVANHLKSKGSACTGDPDTGDGQGNCNLTRTAAANALVNWLNEDPTEANSPHYLIIGDLNSYAKEDPIVALETGGYTNLVAHFGGVYGYVFDGQWGTLDYAMSSSSLLPHITGAEEWHINADEPIILDYNTEFKSPGQIISLYNADPYRASDHDPVVVGIDFSTICAAPLTGARIEGPLNGNVDTLYTFAAIITPTSATTPITYTWNPTPETGQGTLSASYAWATPGAQIITLTVENCGGSITVTRTITIEAPPPVCLPLTDARIEGPLNISGTLYIGGLYTYAAIITPSDATPPITYTWTPTPETGQGTPSVSYLWTTPGVRTITLTVENCGATITATHTITIVEPGPPTYYIYLPLVQRNATSAVFDVEAAPVLRRKTRKVF